MLQTNSKRRCIVTKRGQSIGWFNLLAAGRWKRHCLSHAAKNARGICRGHLPRHEPSKCQSSLFTLSLSLWPLIGGFVAEGNPGLDLVFIFVFFAFLVVK